MRAKGVGRFANCRYGDHKAYARVLQADIVKNGTNKRRRSIRLPGYDYTRPGAYSVTLCSHNRACLFGEVEVDEVRLSRYGASAADAWEWLAGRYSHVSIGDYVVMPNHLHGVLWLHETNPPMRNRKPLGRLIGAFKTVSTKRINELRGTPGAPVWQRNYYERVIRDERELHRTRQYIVDNPAQWAYDAENPNSLGRMQ